MSSQWFVTHRVSLGVGLAITLLVAVVHGLGWTQAIELLAYDHLVRHFSRIPTSDRIVHIDIDDDAIDRVSSWPWPRDLQGELIGILDELGAARIVMDIVWTEPKPPEVRLLSQDLFADTESWLSQIEDLSVRDVVDVDQELISAVREAGNVYLAMYYSKLHTEDGTASDRDPLEAEIRRLLHDDFEQTATELARRLGSDVTEVEPVIADAKRSVATELVRQVLTTRPSLERVDMHDALLSTAYDRLTEDRADILAAYQRVKALEAASKECDPLPETLRGSLPQVAGISPPLAGLTEAARAICFVNFDEDETDSITRRLPLLAQWEDRLIVQLSLRVAQDELGLHRFDLSNNDRRLIVRSDDASEVLRIPVDEQCRILINWPAERLQWQSTFEHVPVTRILQIHDVREGMQTNQILKQQKLAEMIGLIQGVEAQADYARRYRSMIAERRRLERSTAPNDELVATTEELQSSLKAQQAEVIAFVNEVWPQLEAEPDPEDPAIAEDYRRFQRAHKIIHETIPDIESVNARLAVRQEGLITELSPLVRDKICFVGYTATAIADMVSTPAFGRTPGVLIHSSVLNSILQGQFRNWSGLGTQVGLILLIGLVSTIVSCRLEPRQAFALVILLILAAVMINAWIVFGWLDHWLPIVTALVMSFSIWALITLARYLITDRQRRRFGRAVAQYVSPAMAKQLSETAEQFDLAPSEGLVTCFFSDLAGFTTISERLGPEGTKSVLNPYLEAMSQVLHEHNALINKFMGDGIFAFLNPPILPCPDHETAGCEAALDSQAALQLLMDRFRDHPQAEDFKRLFMRIGLATGPVFVGDYGSENKLDYTCVGDTVNLAARLESANKQFGTAIMVAESTYQATHNHYIYRHLGSLQVKGQTIGVGVYELLGRRGKVSHEAVQHAEAFNKAVAAYAHRDWHEATNLFETCITMRPNDPSALRYLKVIDEYRKSPPPADWTGTLELTEK